ncbi:hypothetical protein Taro_042553 [Colocasia esculenta]|uniref:Uncharacterized protein n=1 Tax=Colocasia esculenta TaxID=4460 RepID=A0A843WH55_COLES|nr:hypothetical protein [Colocasia esculenta]
MGACLSVESRRPTPSTQAQMSLNGGGAVSTSVDSADGSSNKTRFMAELSSYEAACKLDPELQSFDSALQQRTSRAISSLAVAVEFRSFSFNSLKEVTGCLLDMNQDAVSIILECKKDIWKNDELSGLVEEYFENSLETLHFCTTLEKCLNKARERQLMIHLALQCFEENEAKKGDSKYARTLEELRNFKAAGDPFGEDFFGVFQSVYRQQLSMLEKLERRKQKVDKKLKSIKTWRKVSSIIFASAFAAVIICSVVAAAMAAPPVAAALVAVASAPVGSMGKWFDSLWKKYQDALKGEKELISAMKGGTCIAIMELESIRCVVEQLEIQINALVLAADFALRDEEAVKIGIGEIKRKLGDFMNSIEDLGKQLDLSRCLSTPRQPPKPPWSSPESPFWTYLLSICGGDTRARDRFDPALVYRRRRTARPLSLWLDEIADF